MKKILVMLVIALNLSAQTSVNGDRTITGAVDNTGATTTKPMKTVTSLAGTCAVGEVVNKTNATATAVIYACTATNTWTAQGAASGLLADPGGSGVMKRISSGVTAQALADDIGAPIYCADAGSTDAYACSLSPAITAYVTGAVYRFKANTANTGAATINLNSLGAKTIVKVAGGVTTALADNDIRSGQFAEVIYDGTNMQLQSTLGNAAASGSTPPSFGSGYNGGVTVTTSATTLCSLSVPGNTLGSGGATNSRCMNFMFNLYNNTGTDNLTFAIDYGSQSFTIASGVGTNNTQPLFAHYQLCNDTGVTNAQALTAVSSAVISGIQIFTGTALEPAQDSTAAKTFLLKATAATTNQTVRVFGCSIQ